MDEIQQQRVAEIIAQYRTGSISRRRAIQLLGAAGLVGILAPVLSHSSALAQDAATPVAGPQADGTNLWTVQVGGMDMTNGNDMHAFFPGEITVNAGDSIWFAFAPMGVPGFHTVTFTSGDELPPLFVPDMENGTPVASPEGPPRLQINPALAFPDGRAAYDGTGYINSGLDVLRVDQGPYILQFTTPGTYDYVCAVHSIVMQGKVTVQEAGSPLPKDLATLQAQSLGETAALVEFAKQAIADAEQALAGATPVAEGATTWNVSVGLGGLSQARVMRFFPREVTIKVGDTVHWTNGTTGEPHTVTFLGGTEQPEDVIIIPQDQGPPKLIQNFQSFLPAGEATFDGTGYHNSGFLGLPPELGAAFGLLGESYDLTFTAAGEYPYYCILHASGPEDEAGMAGKIIVVA